MKRLAFVLLAFILGISMLKGQTFWETYGNVGVEEEGRQIVKRSNELIIGGMRGDSILLISMNGTGFVNWDRTFLFGNGQNKLMKMRIDHEGMLLGLVRVKSFGADENYVFRYDIDNQSFAWVKSWAGAQSHPQGLFLFDLVESNDSTIMVAGQIQTGFPNPPQAYLLRLDLGNGAEVYWGSNTYATGSGDNTYYGITALSPFHGGDLYAIKRVIHAGGNNMRAHLTKLTSYHTPLNENMYFEHSTGSARMYPSEVFFDDRDSTIMMVTHGDMGVNGSLNRDWRIFISKHDLNTNLIWAKELDVPSTQGERVSSMVISPAGGYILYGSTTDQYGLVDRDLFLLGMNMDGDIQWERSYGGAAEEDAATGDDGVYIIGGGNTAVEFKGNIYFVGKTNASGDNDLIIGRADLQGLVNGGSCDNGPLGIIEVPNTVQALTAPSHSYLPTSQTSPTNLSAQSSGVESIECGMQVQTCDVMALNADFAVDTNVLNTYFFNQLSTGLQIDFVIWDFGDGTEVTLHPDSSVSHTFDSNGVYEVCLSIFAFLPDGVCCKAEYCDSIVVDVDPCLFHEADFQRTHYSNGTVTFTDNSTYGNYSIWDFGDGSSGYSLGTGTSINHSYSFPGTYIVNLISVYDVDSTTCCRDTTSQIVRIRRIIPWTIVPVRAKGVLDIDYRLVDVTSVGLTIYDMNGKVRYRKTDDRDEHETIDINQFEQGLYFVEIDYGGIKDQKKFLKE